jgi:hypothetical protein
LALQLQRLVGALSDAARLGVHTQTRRSMVTITKERQDLALPVIQVDAQYAPSEGDGRELLPPRWLTFYRYRPRRPPVQSRNVAKQFLSPHRAQFTSPCLHYSCEAPDSWQSILQHTIACHLSFAPWADPTILPVATSCDPQPTLMRALRTNQCRNGCPPPASHGRPVRRSHNPADGIDDPRIGVTAKSCESTRGIDKHANVAKNLGEREKKGRVEKAGRE